MSYPVQSSSSSRSPKSPTEFYDSGTGSYQSSPGSDRERNMYAEDSYIPSDERIKAEKKSSTAVRREKVAHHKALKLLDQEHAGEAYKPVPGTVMAHGKVVRESHDRGELASVTALQLLDQHVIGGDASMSRSTGGPKKEKKKSSAELRREKVAHFKATKLMNKEHAGEAHKPVPGTMTASGKVVSESRDREQVANVTALQLLDETVAGQGQAYIARDSKTKAMPVKDKKKSSAEARREKIAHHKAMKLMNKEHAGDHHKTVSVRTADGKKVHTTAYERERNANVAALQLLDQEVSAAAYPGQMTAGVSSVRQAMTEQQMKEQQAHEQAKAAMSHQSQIKQRTPAPNVPAGKKMEKMAQTTRRIKKTPEDVRDPETVAGMKCQVDYDREKHAEEKALRLVESPEYKEAADHEGLKVIV